MSEYQSRKLNLIGHLVELRKRLIVSIGVFLLLFLGLLAWAKDIYTLLAVPLLGILPENTTMIATGVTTPFFIPLKVTMLLAFLISLPHSIYQFWRFVSPGLKNEERKLIFPIIIASSLLFLAGMAFCYFLVFPAVFKFISSSSPEGVEMMTDIESYFNFVLGMFMAFGICFQVPIVMVALLISGIVDTAQIRKFRPYFIVISFVIAAILTPPDILSQFMLATPMILLYELALLLSARFRDDNS